jgi:acetyl esterase/lipase
MLEVAGCSDTEHSADLIQSAIRWVTLPLMVQVDLGRSQTVDFDPYVPGEPMTAPLCFRAVSLLTLTMSLSLAAQQPAAVPLWPTGAPYADGTAEIDIPTLATYLPAQNPTRTAVIIAPGGGYVHLSMQKEGEDIARWLNARGVAGFVLKYRLGPKYHHPTELADAQRAIRTVRAQAATLGIAPDHIGMWGFSAGGHLTASAGTLYDRGPLASADAIDMESPRPDFLILSYPVMTTDDSFQYKGLVKNLFGDAPDAALLRLLSPEKQVTAQTPPSFLMATTDDPSVPVMNSVAFYSALVANKVPAEMHLYGHGPHGVGLAPGFPDLKGWPDLLATWMRSRSLMGPAN